MTRFEIRYKPSPGQLAFHQARTTSRERAVLAGTGGGKTHACAAEALDITLREKPDVGLIAAPDYPQLQLSVYPALERLLGRPLSQLGNLASFNQTKKTLTWANGWVWRFVSMDDPTSVEGSEAAFAWLNEARLVRRFSGPDGSWLNITRRLRGFQERARYAFLDTHSPTKGITDTFKADRVEEHTVRGGTWEHAVNAGGDRAVFRWGLRDAIAWGTLDAASGQRIAAAYSGTAAQRILEGRYARAEGLVYQDFVAARNLRRPGDVRPDYYSGGIDWGWDMTAITVHAWTGSRVWTVAEAAIEHASLEDIEKAIRGFQDRYGTTWTWWGGADRPDSCSELRGKGLDVRPVKPHRVMDGVGLLQTRLRAGEWLVAPDCPSLLEDFEGYVLDPAKGEPDKGSYDAHFADAARYGIMGELKGSVRGGITW